jgi:plastocyanin
MANRVQKKPAAARLSAVGVVFLISCLVLGISCKAQDSTGTSSITQTANEVVIDNLAFEPATLNISTGTTVTWANNDSAAHTITARDNTFKSGTLSPGGSFSFTFNEKGTFEYYCTIHPSMTGKIIVE